MIEDVPLYIHFRDLFPNAEDRLLDCEGTDDPSKVTCHLCLEEMGWLPKPKPSLSFTESDSDPVATCSCGEWQQKGGSPTWQFVQWWKHCTKAHDSSLEPYSERKKL